MASVPLSSFSHQPIVATNALRLIRVEPLLSTTSKPNPRDVEIATPATGQHNKPERRTCPRCRVSPSYEPGQYRMECPHCLTVYCWACGVRVEDEEEGFIIHLQWWNVFGCQGLDESKRAHNLAWDAKVLQLAMGLIGVPSLLFGLVVGVFSCAFLPCVKFFATTPKRAFITTVNVFGTVLIYPVTIAAIVLMLPFYPLVALYRRCFPSDDPPNDFL